MGVTMLEACSSGGDDSDMGGGSNNGGGAITMEVMTLGTLRMEMTLPSILITQVLVIYIVMGGITYIKKKFCY